VEVASPLSGHPNSEKTSSSPLVRANGKFPLTLLQEKVTLCRSSGGKNGNGGKQMTQSAEFDPRQQGESCGLLIPATLL